MRPPEVFVMDLSPEEGNRLKRLSKTAKHAAKRERNLRLTAAEAGPRARPVLAANGGAMCLA